MVGDIEKSLFVSYVGNLITPIGLRVGMIGKTGWYIEGKVSGDAFKNISYDWNGETITDYDKPGYYEFNGKNGYSAWSVTGGITFQPAYKFFIYAGAGYGIEETIYQINEYAYEGYVTSQNYPQTGESYVRDLNDRIDGIALDAGVMMRFGKVLVCAGATTLGFKTVNWTVGVGISL